MVNLVILVILVNLVTLVNLVVLAIVVNLTLYSGYKRPIRLVWWVREGHG